MAASQGRRRTAPRAISPTTTTRRTRTIRRQVSRSNARCAKSGYVEKKGNAYYVRFWMDVPGQEERKHMSVRLCPLRGLGKLTKSERERKAREVIAASGADTEQHFKKVEAENLGVTFRQQAEWWLQYVQTRKRKPIKPHTAMTWR